MSASVLNTNVTALLATNNLKRSLKNTNSQIDMLSSGLRVASAKDDVAAFSVSERLTTQVNGLTQAQKNVQDGVSLLQTTDGALSKLTEAIRRMRNLAVQASNGTLTSSDRSSIQQEINQIMDHINNISSTAKFNGKRLLGPDPKTPSPADIVFLVDSSASMGGEINNVVNGLNTLTNGLKNAGLDAKYAVVDVNDVRYDPGVAEAFPGNGFGANLTQDLTSNTAAVSNALNSLFPLTASAVQNYEAIQDTLPGGGDVPSYRGGNTLKFFVQVTDTGIEAGDTSSEAAQQANLTASNTTYFGIVDPTKNNLYDGLANSTGGQLFDINSADYNPILSAISNSIIATAVGTKPLSPITIQAGADQGQEIKLNVPADMRTSQLGINNAKVDTIANSQQAITMFDTALEKVNQVRAKVAAGIHRLEHANEQNGVQKENLTNSRSLIRDADLAKNMVDLTVSRLKNQAGFTAARNAIINPQNTLTLLR